MDSLLKKNERILIVDDEERNRELLQGILESLGYQYEVACDGLEALTKTNNDVDVILLDVVMPGLDGYEVARRIREDSEFRDLPIIMVTALGSKEDRLRAVQAGANDFISKPIDKTELLVRMKSLLKMKQAQDLVKDHNSKLEQLVGDRTRALRQALDKMIDAEKKTQEAHRDTIRRLALASEYKDSDTAAHIRRIADYCVLLARALNMSSREVELIAHASPMHDVGKIGIPDSILLKPGKLNAHEWETMRQHTVIGARILHGSPSELLQVGEIIALTHHEKWDGSGYPRGLSGEDIPIWGRICAVADVFDALTSKRPYKHAFFNDEALAIMVRERGKHFDPKVFDAFIEHFDDVIAIKNLTHRLEHEKAPDHLLHYQWA